MLYKFGPLTASQVVCKFHIEKVTSNKQIFRELLTWQIVTPITLDPSKCTWLSSCPEWWRRMTGCQDGQEDAGHEFSGVRSPEWTVDTPHHIQWRDKYLECHPHKQFIVILLWWGWLSFYFRATSKYLLTSFSLKTIKISLWGFNKETDKHAL